MSIEIYGLDVFGVNVDQVNPRLAELVMGYKRGPELGAVALNGALRALAQKCEVIHDGRGVRFGIRDEFEQQVFDVLKEGGLCFNVRRAGNSLRPCVGEPKTLRITQMRDGNAIRFYAEEFDDIAIAILFDDRDEIIFDTAMVELALLLDGHPNPQIDLAAEFAARGLDVVTVRLVDAMARRDGDRDD